MCIQYRLDLFCILPCGPDLDDVDLTFGPGWLFIDDMIAFQYGRYTFYILLHDMTRLTIDNDTVLCDSM